MVTDKKWISIVNKIKDPIKACRILYENEQFLGYDPYYKDLRRALIEMCKRCGTNEPTRSSTRTRG